MPTRTVCLIPARLGSSRLPRKMLFDRTGKPLVVHTHQACQACDAFDEVHVVAASREIATRCGHHDVPCILSYESHENGTSRVAEAARMLDLPSDAIVVNVQGDEPEVDPDNLVGLVRHHTQRGSHMATLVAPLAVPRFIDTNVVKAFVNDSGRCAWFARHVKGEDSSAYAAMQKFVHHHVGVYSYRMDTLQHIDAAEPTRFELSMRLEQMRAVELGIPIDAIDIPHAHPGIDTQEDYDGFVARYRASVAG